MIDVSIRGLFDTEPTNWFTNFEFVESLNLSPEMFIESAGLDRAKMYGQCTYNETNFLYNFVRKIKPKRIMEFSPSCGYTTSNICLALVKEGVEVEYFETYELDQKCVEHASANFRELGINNIVDLVVGDVLETFDLEKLKKCDFLYIDSEHDKDFCQKYVDKFFDLIPKDTWVGIHDISFVPVMNGETEVVTKWIKDRNIADYFYIPDVLRKFGINDKTRNPLNPRNMETSITLWFKR